MNDTKPLKTFIDPAKFEKDLAFDENSVNEAMMRHPALSAYYVTQMSHAVLQYERAKMQRDMLHATLYRKTRKKLEQLAQEDANESGNKVKNVTEKQVESLLLRSPHYKSAVERYSQAKSIKTLCEGVCEAFKQRGFSINKLAGIMSDEKGRTTMTVGENVRKSNNSMMASAIQDAARAARDKRDSE